MSPFKHGVFVEEDLAWHLRGHSIPLFMLQLSMPPFLKSGKISSPVKSHKKTHKVKVKKSRDEEHG